MTIQNPITATLDEIVFEGRNQAYGAFVLRKLYDRHLATAIGTAALLCLLVSAVPLAWHYLVPESVIVAPPRTTVVAEPTIIILPKPPLPAATVVPTAPAVPAPAVARPAAAAAATATKVVADIRFKPQKEVLPETTTADVIQETTSDLGTGSGEAVGTGTGEATGTGAGEAGTAVAPPSDKPFEVVEAMPQFAGGPEALRRYLQRQLRYPQEALRNGVAGKVFVAFVVRADGSISNVEIVKGLGYGTDEEAARVVRNMPAWTPGRQNNHAVAVRYTLPITFRYE